MVTDFAEKTNVVLEILLFYQQMQNPLSGVDGNVYIDPNVTLSSTTQQIRHVNYCASPIQQLSISCVNYISLNVK